MLFSNKLKMDKKKATLLHRPWTIDLQSRESTGVKKSHNQLLCSFELLLHGSGLKRVGLLALLTGAN